MTRLAVRFAALFVPLLFVISAMTSTVDTPVQESSAGEDMGFAACKLPCWAGITPGRTHFAQANQLMARHLPAFSIPTFLTTSTLTFQTVSSDPMISGSLYYDGGRVSEIHLDVGLPAGYLLDTLGTPDCVWVSRGNPQIVLTLYWEQNGLSTGAYFVLSRDRSWQRDMLTRFLQISTIQNCDIPGILPWQGFARAWRYEALASGDIAVP
jgi:hypothetical protein